MTRKATVERLIDKLRKLDACAGALEWVHRRERLRYIYDNVPAAWAVWLAARILGKQTMMPMVRKAILFSIYNFDQDLHDTVKDMKNTNDLMQVYVPRSGMAHYIWNDIMAGTDRVYDADNISQFVGSSLDLTPKQLKDLTSDIKKLISFKAFAEFVRK